LKEDKRELTPAEKVENIIEQAKIDIQKIDKDIKNLSGKGTSQLQFNPPGIISTDVNLQSRNIDKLDMLKEQRFTLARNEALKISMSLPEGERDKLNDKILSELSGRDDQFQKDNKPNIASKFFSNMGFKEFPKDEFKQPISQEKISLTDAYNKLLGGKDVEVKEEKVKTTQPKEEKEKD
jgi:hypothetical protein